MSVAAPVAACRLTRSFQVFIYLLLAFITMMAGGGSMVGAVLDPRFPRWILPFWFAVLAWIWYVHLSIPYALELTRDDLLVARSIVKTTVIPVREVISIKAAPLSLGFAKLKHEKGALRLITQMTGFYEVVYRLKALNPAVEVRGC